MLFGIRPAEQERLAAQGETVRVYVPYGDEWYGYFMRRLAERPANVAFFLRAMATRAMTTFALIGVGKLGEALLSGLIRSGRAKEQVHRRRALREPGQGDPGPVRRQDRHSSGGRQGR